MEKQPTIYFSKSDDNTDEITIWSCIKMTWYYFLLSVRKISHAINRIVHTYSWLVVFFTALTAFHISSVCIRSARAERDSSVQQQYKLEQQIETLQCQLEVSK